MGQYWMPILKNEDGKLEYLCTHDWDNGYKFMEHCYVENPVPNMVMFRIFKNPLPVAWVGDYCEEPIWEGGPKGQDLWDDKELDKMFKLINYNSIPDYRKSRVSRRPNDKEVSDQDVLDMTRLFSYRNLLRYTLVNHTKEEYLSMNEYLSKFQVDDWIINPLPVLVATPSSMGDGGGDYYSSNTNFDKVGKWCWDSISVEEDIPEGYSKLNTDEYVFEEKRND